MMKETVFLLQNLQQTELFGRCLGDHALAGDVICLDGDLGSGKTALAQAIATGLAVPPSCYVTSPSFTVFHEYPGRIPMYHFDFYRLHNHRDVEDLGFEEFFYHSGCTVIEWSVRAEDILPEERLSLRLEIIAEEARRVYCRYAVERWEERLGKILSAAHVQQPR
jgi:tRNA threonylcarbamoyladenosine biosynthesis protein TsaE